MQLPIEIETSDFRLGFDIAGKNGVLKAGSITDAPGGVRILFEGMTGEKAFDIPSILHFIVDASVKIELSLFSAWLFDP